ncbi:hypothetical protein AaE_009800 [Aphanomyces astaci]|uniref:RING-type domain-containing protein n=1 Tax=Aphanomyces astaci TaxID=112090 RepID=A0A6A5A774_APHAT|nr:hypothetical protein AaE_009800 [Aphanomyces astaci]
MVEEPTRSTVALTIAQQVHHRIATLLADHHVPRKPAQSIVPPPPRRSAHQILQSLHRRRTRQHVGQINRVMAQMQAHINRDEAIKHSFVPACQECAICLEDMALTSRITVRRLPCGHTFHAHCIKAWSVYQCTCPYDRRPFVRLAS